jgi:nickel-dependent lactate racemase
MEIRLPYAGRYQNFDTDDFGPLLTFGGSYSCKFPEPVSRSTIESKISDGLRNFKNLFNNSKVLTVVNDGYRRTPTAEILPIIWDFIKYGDFIIATGTHRQPTEIELQTIFGQFYDKIKPRLFIHDCYDQDSLVEFGQTSYGTPVYLNKKISEADLILTINSVEPHFFAGFTGGRKSLIPGLAAFETVQKNHRFAKDINATTLSLDNNPLHLDLEEGIKLIGDKVIITIQCITNRDGRLIDLFVDKLNDAFMRACARAEECYTIELPKKYEVVIACCDQPLDSNLYQLQKAQEHGGRMVKTGGVLITMGACLEGTGSDYFMKLADKYPTPESALTEGIKDDSFGIHKLIKTARQLQKFKVFYVTTLDEHQVEKVYFKSFKDIKTAVEAAMKEFNTNFELAVLEDAGYSVPVIKP